MELTIVGTTLYKQTKVEWIEVMTTSGSFIIQDGYAPSILILAPGKKISYKLLDQDIQSMLIQKGILNVDREHATLLIHTQ